IYRPYYVLNATSLYESYTLSLHDALPISRRRRLLRAAGGTAGHLAAAPASRLGHPAGDPRPQHTVAGAGLAEFHGRGARRPDGRSEEPTSELQSRENLVCRLLLEKKNKSQ